MGFLSTSPADAPAAEEDDGGDVVKEEAPRRSTEKKAVATTMGLLPLMLPRPFLPRLPPPWRGKARPNPPSLPWQALPPPKPPPPRNAIIGAEEEEEEEARGAPPR